jgi:RNA polymerase sigma-70 factor (ECF subfamily)
MTSIAIAEDATALDFATVARRHGRDLYRLAYRLCGNTHTAEDLVQESLTRAWRSLHKLQDARALKGWLYTILRRENARRFERPHPLEADIPVDELCAARKTYDTSTEAFVLRRAIRALPPEYREPLILQVIHGYTQEEIAGQLGLTAGGVGTRLFRARRRLRDAIGEAA